MMVIGDLIFVLSCKMKVAAEVCCQVSDGRRNEVDVGNLSTNLLSVSSNSD
jgi:hypothetical protein